ncbi:hypothetical protein bpuCAU1_001465 (plasmid) [Borrelia puertoricensis]|uniref:hypothetical protein n=1 Tax=Borrelia puertoricensis TaxID=2756107 RepID=UPI003EBB4566
MKRLKNEAARKARFFRRRDNNLPVQLSRTARDHAENSLDQLKCSVDKLTEAKGRIKI